MHGGIIAAGGIRLQYGVSIGVWCALRCRVSTNDVGCTKTGLNIRPLMGVYSNLRGGCVNRGVSAGLHGGVITVGRGLEFVESIRWC